MFVGKGLPNALIDNDKLRGRWTRTTGPSKIMRTPLAQRCMIGTREIDGTILVLECRRTGGYVKLLGPQGYPGPLTHLRFHGLTNRGGRPNGALDDAQHHVERVGRTTVHDIARPGPCDTYRQDAIELDLFE